MKNRCLQNPDWCFPGVTLSFWVMNLRNPDGFYTILKTKGYRRRKLGFCFGLGGEYFWIIIRTNSHEYRNRIPPLEVNEWQHVTFTFTIDGTIVLYVNGCDSAPYRLKGYKLVTAISGSATAVSTYMYLRLGSETYGSHMNLDHVLIWYDVLSADKIWKLYLQGEYPFAISKPVVIWRAIRPKPLICSRLFCCDYIIGVVYVRLTQSVLDYHNHILKHHAIIFIESYVKRILICWRFRRFGHSLSHYINYAGVVTLSFDWWMFFSIWWITAISSFYPFRVISNQTKYICMDHLEKCNWEVKSTLMTSLNIVWQTNQNEPHMLYGLLFAF